MQPFKPSTKNIPPGILAISLLMVYLTSMAPGLTWANFGSDGGDLIAAAATGGVAHPTGYPVYLLIARLFQWMPIGSLAYRTNLLSAFAAVFAALLVYGMVTRSLSERNWLAGLISAYAFGLAPLLWSQAVITEVYALHALFVALILYVAAVPLSLTSKQQDCAQGLIFGLAMGNHVTTILLLPVILFSTISQRDDPAQKIIQWKVDFYSLARRLSWMGAGLLVYLTLPLRSLSHPQVNWGNPLTLDGFGWLVSGKLYQDQLFVLTFSSALERSRAAASLLIEQFGVLGLTIGLIGLIVFYNSSRLYRNTIWTVIAFSVFAVVYDTSDSFLYLIPAFLCFAIWIGLGLNGLMDMTAQRFPKAGSAIGLMFILYLFVLAGTHWPQVDASHDARAERFGRQVLTQSPANAIVFAKGDEAIFTMWYFHYALGERPDLVIVATDLLHFDWYQESLHFNYPNLVLPGLFPFAERMASLNPERPVCHIQFDLLAQVNCSSPK